MKYVNLTPTWEEILPTWRFMAEQVTTRDKPRNGSDPNAVMMEFWGQMALMAQAADNFNALVAELHNMAVGDEKIEAAITRGRAALETDRNTIKESIDE